MAKVELKDLDLEIKEGEFVTLLGPSGCGKSTTLLCTAGLEEPTSGTILFDDQPVNDLSPRDRNVAMVFQDYALYPHMTVYDNMAFSLRLHKTPEDMLDERVREVASMLGIAPLLDRLPAQLSGGQRQRVALGRALVRNPVVLLLDEPLSNLDAALRIRARTEIKRLQLELGLTTIYVTHDQEEAMVISDRIAILNEGALQQVGASQEVYADPRSLFVARFIGSPAMNFIAGEMAVREQSIVFRFDGGTVMFPCDLVGSEARRSGLGNKVILGIRPEHIKVHPEKGMGDFAAEVFLVEPVGPVNFVDLSIGDLVLKARTSPDLELAIGDSVEIECEKGRAYFFDPETEQRL
jgi:ABC-type sugar transport system ATPase subunit